MRKKAVFLARQHQHSIDTVYSTTIRNSLASLVDMYPFYIDWDNAEEHAEALRTAEFAFSTWGMPAFSGEEIERYLPDLKTVFYAAGSVQSFARPFLERGIEVVSAWAANAVPVAEYTVAQILLANKGFYQTVSLCKENREKARQFSTSLPGNYDVKVGILGAGMVGKKVIELLRSYRLDIYVFDPFLPDEQAKQTGVVKTTLEEIFSRCLVISNHLANLPETAGMLNGSHFQRMLPYATFLNTGRGAQVVEADLVHALQDVPTRTAVLDVTDPEPLPPDSGLLKLPNVFLTPHIAGSQGREVERMACYMLEELQRKLNGEPLIYQVTADMLKTMA